MNFSQRIKLLYVPFLVSAFCLWVLYTFLNWLLIIHLEVITVKDVIVNFGLPLVLPWIPILLYINPRLKLLKIKIEGVRDRSTLYMIILWIILFVPSMIAQSYIETATGKLTELQNISEVDSLPRTKYYSVKHFYIEKKNIAAHTSFEVTGKHNEDFNMNIFVVVPMYNNYVDTLHVRAWLGIVYSKRISNNLEDNEKEEAYKLFADETQKEFDDADLTKFVYLSRVPNSDDRIGFHEALKQYTTDIDVHHAQIFFSKDEPFADRNGYKGGVLLAAAIFGAIVWLLMMLTSDVDKNALQIYESGKLDINAGTKEFIDYCKPKEGFFITPIIMYLNIGIFLCMFFMGLGFMSFESTDLIAWGGNYGPLTMQGQWWRLISNTFLHGGFMHLAANMYGLLFVGIFLEPLLGRNKYLGIYLATGIIASITSLWWNENIVSIGASGAIFGLYGTFLALLVTRVFPKEMATTFIISTLIFVGYNLVIGILGNGTDNAAHVGGLLSGFLIGLALSSNLKHTAKIDAESNIND